MIAKEYLGITTSILLESKPFVGWPIEKSHEGDLAEPIIEYVFKGHGLELRCDCHGEITVIFLHSKEYGGFDESLFEIPFSFNRKKVIEYYGVATMSGEQSSHPILGEFGAWDRFEYSGFAIHIEYTLDLNRIKKITLMCSDLIP